MQALPHATNIIMPVGSREETATSQRYSYQIEKTSGGRYVNVQCTLSGHGVMRWRGRDYTIPPGHAFIFIVPEKFSYSYPPGAKEPWTFAWIELYGPLARYLATSMREAHGAVIPLPLGSEVCKQFLHLAAIAQKRRPNPPHDITFAITTFFLNWQRLLDRPKAGDTDPVATVMRICQTRFREQLSLKELAAQAQITREHLSRLFTKRTGISPARYLCQIRLAAAQEILRMPRATQKEAAFRSGFPSVQALQRALAAAKAGN